MRLPECGWLPTREEDRIRGGILRHTDVVGEAARAVVEAVSTIARCPEGARRPTEPVRSGAAGRGAAGQSTFASHRLDLDPQFRPGQPGNDDEGDARLVRAHDAVADGDERLHVHPVGEIDVEVDDVGEAHARGGGCLRAPPALRPAAHLCEPHAGRGRTHHVFVASQLGHANPSTTLKHYAAFIPGTGGQYADMLETVSGKSGRARAVGASEVSVESSERRGSSVAEQLIRKQPQAPSDSPQHDVSSGNQTHLP